MWGKGNASAIIEQDEINNIVLLKQYCNIATDESEYIELISVFAQKIEEE